MTEPRVPERLRTARLLLRRFTAADRAPFAALHEDPEVWEHLSPVPIDRAATDALLDRVDSHWAREGFGLYAVELAGSGQLAGFVGLSHHRALPDEVELGWRLARPLWGHGYATEGARACLGLAWDALLLERVVSIAVPQNVRSIAVMQRLGFRPWLHDLAFEGWSLVVHVADRPPGRV